MHLKRVINSAPASPCQRVFASTHKTYESTAPLPPGPYNARNPNGNLFRREYRNLWETSRQPHAMKPRPHTQSIHVHNIARSDQQMPWEPAPSYSGSPFHIPVDNFLGSRSRLSLPHPFLRGCLDIAANGGQAPQKLAQFARLPRYKRSLRLFRTSPAVSGTRNCNTKKKLYFVKLSYIGQQSTAEVTNGPSTRCVCANTFDLVGMCPSSRRHVRAKV